MNGEVLQSQVVPTELQTGDDPYLWLEEGCAESEISTRALYELDPR